MITAFDLRAGMNIAKDNVVAKIQGMDPVWVTAAIGVHRTAGERCLAVYAHRSGAT